MNKKSAFRMAVVVAAAALLGHLIATHFDKVVALLMPTEVAYSTQPQWLEDSMDFQPLGWESLIPAFERDILNKYQVDEVRTVSDLTAQILNSIESASDQSYKEAMMSTNTVEELAGQAVAISGFVVPIDFYPNKEPKTVFLVPYFGACIHFPPPPPNQILFAQLEQGFKGFDMNQAYTFKGKLKIELFEDLLGTSAYSIELASAEVFVGQPDTFRNHGDMPQF